MIDRILPDLYRITLPMPFRLRHVHVYALLHDGRVALFDTGMNIPETYKVLDEALAAIGRATKDIDRIFLTHMHADHCGIAGRIQEISGAAVYLSAPDDARLPYIVWQCQSPPRDVRGVGTFRVMVDTLYVVKAVSQGTSYAPLAPVAAAIDRALTNPVGDSVEDGLVLTSVRNDQFSMREVAEGTEFRHLGGEYRIQAQG